MKWFWTLCTLGILPPNLCVSVCVEGEGVHVTCYEHLKFSAWTNVNWWNSCPDSVGTWTLPHKLVFAVWFPMSSTNLKTNIASEAPTSCVYTLLILSECKVWNYLETHPHPHTYVRTLDTVTSLWWLNKDIAWASAMALPVDLHLLSKYVPGSSLVIAWDLYLWCELTLPLLLQPRHSGRGWSTSV